MASNVIRLDLAASVAWITLNRPERLHAMEMAWIAGLHAAVDQVAQARDVRVVVVRGAGTSFCAGLDLDMLAAEGMPDGFY